MPNHYLLKTWANPTGHRELRWSCGLTRDQIYNLDMLQSTIEFKLDEGHSAYCVSFLDGLQKVIMFVETLGNS